MSIRTLLRTTADSFTNTNFPNRNYGDKPGLSVAGTEQQSFIAFSLKAVSFDAVLAEAWLRLHLRGDWDGTNTITVKRITSRWRESTITANDEPNVSDVNDATLVVTNGVAGDLIEIDVTDMVAQALAGANFHGFRVQVDTTDLRRFQGSEVQDHSLRPRLQLIYDEEVTPPTNLHPRAGHAVNSSLPRLAWDVDTQSASWVQVATTTTGFDSATGFASPEYDDGDWVENIESLYDLSTTAYAGVPDDEERWWCVAIKDEDGNESVFSEPARFERHTYGTLTIDSPTTDVSTHSPTVLTTFTGRTLTRIDWTLYRIYDVFDPPILLEVTFGSSTDDDFEIRRGILYRDATYHLTVRAFDEFSRGNVPNETSYVREDVEFAYIPGATAPVTDLEITQAEPRSPVITATWQRANAPDEFNIYLNGVLMESVDSGDAFVTGTTYAWSSYYAQPRIENTVEVVASENEDDSDPVAATVTPIVEGVWIIAPDRNIVLPVFAKGRRPTLQTGVVELGETKVPLSGDPVRLVDSSGGGLQGTLDGDLVRVPVAGDVEAVDAREKVLRIKRLGPTEHVRLIWGRRNIRVIFDELQALDEGFEPEENYRIQAAFWQVAE